jgi:hypothetical protein
MCQIPPRTAVVDVDAKTTRSRGGSYDVGPVYNEAAKLQLPSKITTARVLQ